MCYDVSMKDDNFRIKLKTKDGILVQDRSANPDHWYKWNGLAFDEENAERNLKRDCIGKGVRLLSYTYDIRTGVIGIVEWL